MLYIHFFFIGEAMRLGRRASPARQLPGRVKDLSRAVIGDGVTPATRRAVVSAGILAHDGAWHSPFGRVVPHVPQLPALPMPSWKQPSVGVGMDKLFLL